MRLDRGKPDEDTVVARSREVADERWADIKDALDQARLIPTRELGSCGTPATTTDRVTSIPPVLPQH
jgi:hypothetical protein